MKIGKLLNNDFSRALKNISNKELPATASFQITMLLKQIDEHKKVFEETRQKLLDVHCKKNKKGERLTITKENGALEYDLKDRKKFDKEYNELLGLEVAIKRLPFEILATVNVAPGILKILVGTVFEEPK